MQCGGGGLPIGGPTCDPPLPRVEDWAVYNEPNQGLFLLPQRRRGRAVSPGIYRRLFLAAQGGAAHVGPRQGPAADRRDGAERRRQRRRPDRVPARRPLPAAELHPPARLRADPRDRLGAPSLHAGPRPLPPLAQPRPDQPGDDEAPAAGAAAGRAGRRDDAGSCPIYITEFGIQSVPDREFGVSLKRQAEYLGIAEYLAFHNRGVRSYAQYLLRDDPIAQDFAFTTGLRLEDGRKKPSYSAFALALAVKSLRGGRVLVWGHVRPRGNRRVRVAIRVDRRGGKPRRVRRVRAEQAGLLQLPDGQAAGPRASLAGKHDTARRSQDRRCLRTRLSLLGSPP